MAEKVLIIDDDRLVTSMVQKALAERGFGVAVCNESARYRESVEREKPGLVILDVNMPGLGGFDVLRSLRSVPETAGVPVMMLTDRSDVEDKVLGFETGADDYLPKPFSILELAARVKNLFHRAARGSGSEMMESRRTFGDLTIDFSAATASREGALIPLSRIEYTLLALLARDAGKTLDKETLMKGVWGDAYVDDPFLLKSHIRYLRRKIEKDPRRPEHIVTVHGKGYQFR